ncbi:hypothetical protein [Butyrivibrio sp. VCD2006]|uniref:hypothetical protein n=1 Tax=Butyrivibrio sp. VCD2006 TaxID=1280664 RepID=UPI00041F2274|nr:hypothetical protein [Butyrivibrio sp. VCD2006]
MAIMSIAIGVICTALMFGAVIWILVLERSGDDDEFEHSKEDNRKNSEEKSKEGKQ